MERTHDWRSAVGKVTFTIILSTPDLSFKAEGRLQGKHKSVPPNFGICCKEIGGLKVTDFYVYARSFYSASVNIKIEISPFLCLL